MGKWTPRTGEDWALGALALILALAAAALLASEAGACGAAPGPPEIGLRWVGFILTAVGVAIGLAGAVLLWAGKELRMR